MEHSSTPSMETMGSDLAIQAEAADSGFVNAEILALPVRVASPPTHVCWQLVAHRQRSEVEALGQRPGWVRAGGGRGSAGV